MERSMRADLMVQQQVGSRWQHMVGVICLNKTRREKVKKMLPAFFEKFPTALDLLNSNRDEVAEMLKDLGIKASPEVGQDAKTASTWVLEFPVKAPDNCITRKDVTALDQLKHYKNLQHNWCEHNASMTVYVRDDEWFEVGNWVYQNWDIINGVSFLPYDGGHYKLAPYEEIDVHTYERLIKTLPLIDYNKLTKYELEDNTQGKQELACSGDSCDI